MPASVYTRLGVTAIPAPGQVERQHIVTAGEELPGIAAHEYNEGYHSVHWRDLAEANEIDDLDAVTVGDILKVPTPNPATT